MNPRAITYRRLNKIPEHWGTAVNVQTMVFGNMGESSATGVAFTRDPATGENKFYGEFLINAQGEDVVADPDAAADQPGGLERVGEEQRDRRRRPEEKFPVFGRVHAGIYQQLLGIRDKLETLPRDAGC